MNQPKNIIIASCVILFAFFSSCHGEKNNTIEITGNIKGLNTSWIYLFNTYPVGSKPIDSARITHDTFSFKFQPDTVYEPHQVFISTKDRKLFLSVIDPYAPNDGKKHWYHDFVMENGVTELKGDLTKSKGITINSGLQNKFRFENFYLPFTQLSDNAAKHKDEVEKFIEKVKNKPDAYYAMFALSNLKFQVNKSELKQMYNAFDKETKQAYSGRQVKEFLDNKPDENALACNNLLTNSNGKKANMIDNSKRLNMVIFWASWCGPCRLEIPSLKKIASKIKDSRFRMASVSIDKDTLAWKKAMAEEKMSWEQFSIDPKIMNRMIAQYNLDAIPLIYLIDSKRKIVKHMTGFESANEEIFKKIINDFLKTN